jgi:hypothetical protein
LAGVFRVFQIKGKGVFRHVPKLLGQAGTPQGESYPFVSCGVSWANVGRATVRTLFTT